MAENGKLRILGIGDAKSRHFARWANRLAEKGHDVHVASGRANPRGELEGIEVHRFQELDPLLRVPVLRRYRMAPALEKRRSSGTSCLASEKALKSTSRFV